MQSSVRGGGFLIALGLGLVSVAVGCSSETTSPEPGPSDGGTSVVPGPAVPGNGDGGAVSCKTAGEDCTGNVEACCNGSTCVAPVADPSKATCADTCLNDSQCKSGCCKVLTSGAAAVCAPATVCAGSCGAPGASCAGNVSSCCSNAICVSTSTDPGTCAARCTAHSECKSGCCAPLTNSSDLVCSPVSFCQ